jgi:hypothetical protein
VQLDDSSVVSRGCGACDCPGHRRAAARVDAPPTSIWSALVPILACALCPACVTMYSSLLATFGLGLAMSETQHHALLAVAVVIALGFSAWRATRTGRWRFVALTALGCALLGGAHAIEELPALSWAGIVVLLFAGWRDRRAR